MTKVLYLITKSHWGGAGKYVFDLATSAQGQGFQVAVALGEGPELADKLTTAGIRVICLPHLNRDIKIWADIKTFFDLLKLLRAEQPDVIHLNSSKIGALGALAGRLTGVKKIIFTGHGWAFNEQRFFLNRWLIALIHWLTILLCHQTIAVSQTTAKQIGIFPLVKNKIIVIHNGLETPQFLSKNEARNKLDPDNQSTIWLGTITELHKNKGLDILILALKKVLEKIPGLNLIVIGEGEERDNLARLIARYQLTTNIRLVGKKDNAAQYLPAFDLFVLPSRTEALPYALLEAGTAGLPVIASRVGGIPEIIESGESGALVPAENTHVLADKILELLTNKDLTQKFGQNLQHKISSNFSRKKMLDQTFALY